MDRSATALLALLLASCSAEVPTATPPAPAPAAPLSASPARPAPAPPRPFTFLVPAHRLPVLGTVGDLPPAAHRLVVEVDRAGALRADGRDLDMEGLRQVLVARAAADRDFSRPPTTDLHVVLRVDRDLPWKSAAWLLQECAAPDVLVHRVLFAALPEDGGEEGAVAAFLPVEPWPPREEPEAGGVTCFVRARLELARVGDGEADDAPGAMAPDLARCVALAGTLPIRGEIDAGPLVPTGAVLAALDTFLRSGVASVVFGDVERRAGRPLAGVPDGDALRGRLRIHLLDRRVGSGAGREGPSPVPRVHGTLAGVTASPSPPEPEAEPEDALPLDIILERR